MFPSENSSKLDKSLMDAYLEIHEGVRKGHAAGDTDIAKQASQLASDVKYKAKGKVKPGANKEEIKKVYMTLLGASPAPAPVKVLAKKKLLGEGYDKPDEKMKTDRDGYRVPKKDADEARERILAKAKKKKKEREEVSESGYFPTRESQRKDRAKYNLSTDELPSRNKPVKRNPDGSLKTEQVKPEFTGQSGYDKSQKPVNDYLKNTPEGKEGQKNKKRVEADMKKLGIGESAMPEKDYKPTKEPSKPNVEKKPRPSVKLEGLDPVGREDKDVDNDGDHDKSDKYLLKRRGAIKKAIAKRRMKEGFSDWRQDLSFNEESKK